MDTQSQNFCGQCGTANPQTSNFCSKCGAALVQAEVAAVQTQPAQPRQACQTCGTFLSDTGVCSRCNTISIGSAISANPQINTGVWVGLGFLGFVILLGMIGSTLDTAKTSSDAQAPAPIAQRPAPPTAAQKKEQARQKKVREEQERALDAEELRQTKVKAEQEARYQAFQARRKREAKEALADFRKKTDDINDVTFYYHPSAPESVLDGNAIQLYFGKVDDTFTSLRLKIQYKAEDWLFIERFVFKADGDIYTIEPEYGQVEKDNSGGLIWEWYDQPVTQESLKAIRAVIESKKAALRYDGQQYIHDEKIDATTKEGMKEMLETFLALGGTI